MVKIQLAYNKWVKIFVLEFIVWQFENFLQLSGMVELIA
jgi:hypothetical protein